MNHTLGRPVITIGQHSTAGRKERNDDSYGVLAPEPPLLLTKGIAMAVADGMTTADAGKEASEICIRSFLEDYYCTHESWPVKKSVARVLTAINTWLYTQGQTQYLSNRGMISTFTAAVLKSSVLHIFHAGDSRITRLRDGVLEPLTRDHRVRVSRDRDYLSRAMGVDTELEIDYRSEPVSSGDIYIFTTDGVHEHLSSVEIRKHISDNQNDLDSAAKAINDAAYTNGSPDNLTCQIVRIDKKGDADEEIYFQKLGQLPFPPELGPGVTLDGYKITETLHASKRSQVYLALNMETNETVAIKTPSVNYEDDPLYIEMFTREEWIGRRIKNPNVVRVIEPPSHRKLLYYVTEYVEGQTLRDWMNENPRPTHMQVREMIDQIASGLRAFHRKDMVHQDLKPENIVIDSHGTIKIIDFGSTAVAGLAEASNQTAISGLLGTVDYTAPEYHLGQKPTNRSDIYSLGVIAYEMLTGKHPYGRGFENKGDLSKLSLTPATEHNSSLPVWVSGALDKAININPEKRYDVLSAFIADMARPNPELENTAYAPLIERNPVLFWKFVALIALLLNFITLVAFLS